jgi:hypothetical protein
MAFFDVRLDARDRLHAGRDFRQRALQRCDLRWGVLLREFLRAQWAGVARLGSFEDSDRRETSLLLLRFVREALLVLGEGPRRIDVGSDAALRLQQLCAFGREPRELQTVGKRDVDARERCLEDDSQRGDRVLPRRGHRVREACVSSLREQRVGLGRTIATQSGNLRESTFDSPELLAEPAKLGLLPNMVVIDRAEEVRKRVLQREGEPVVVRPVE